MAKLNGLLVTVQAAAITLLSANPLRAEAFNIRIDIRPPRLEDLIQLPIPQPPVNIVVNGQPVAPQPPVIAPPVQAVSDLIDEANKRVGKIHGDITKEVGIGLGNIEREGRKGFGNVETSIRKVDGDVAKAQAQTQTEVSRGELPYSTHCLACNSSQLHWRDKQAAQNWAGLKTQVRRWQSARRPAVRSCGSNGWCIGRALHRKESAGILCQEIGCPRGAAHPARLELQRGAKAHIGVIDPPLRERGAS